MAEASESKSAQARNFPREHRRSPDTRRTGIVRMRRRGSQFTLIYSMGAAGESHPPAAPSQSDTAGFKRALHRTILERSEGRDGQIPHGCVRFLILAGIGFFIWSIVIDARQE